ncbi:MAG: oligosaccharide flippase family protein [Thermosynechococcaceae cyanobacterium]
MKPKVSPIPLSLRRNFSWTLTGNIVYSACQWGMLIIFAKLGTPEMVGEFTYALAVTAPVFMLTNLQLRAVQATDSQVQYKFSDYLALRLMATGIGLLAIFSIVSLFPHSNTTAWIVILVAIAKGIESISDVCYGFIQQHERMDFISISLILKGILSLSMLTVGLVLTGSVVGGVAGLAIAWLLLLLGYDWLTVRRLAKLLGVVDVRQLRPRWQWTTQRQLIWLTLPLGFVMLLISLNTNIPRYFIEHYLSARELGIFAAIAYLMLMGSIIQGALAQSAAPRLAKYYAEGKRDAFISLLFKLVALACVLGTAVVVVSSFAGKQILALVYKPEYAQYSHLLVWLMVAAAMDYVSSFLGTAMTAARYFRVQVPLFMSTAGTLAIACVLFIPRWGLDGIPFAMILTGLIRILASLAILAHGLCKPIALDQEDRPNHALPSLD